MILKDSQMIQQQRNKNATKLILQNKKLRQEVQIFEQQLNIILNSTNSINSPHKKLTSFNFKQPTEQDKIFQVLNNQIIQQQQKIKQLKTDSEYLKSTNIKENIHYILKEEDELKIIKKQLYKLRKEKQVITDFVKDKSKKLKFNNQELQTHRKLLQNQLKQTIKFNRQSAAKIVQIQRQIRKYHLNLQNLKHLSKKQNTETKTKIMNPEFQISKIDNEISNIKKQINKIQQNWNAQINSLDQEYFQLKQKLFQKKLQAEKLKDKKIFHNIRILPIKNEQVIQKNKERTAKLVQNPALKKELQNYLKQEQQKIRKKQLYLKKNTPLAVEQLQSKNQKKNPQKDTEVLNMHNDKNVIKLKNYMKKKAKLDKQIEANKHEIQSDRIQRSWSTNKDQQNQSIKLKQKLLSLDSDRKKQYHKPRILLKNTSMGTTFHQSEDQK